MTTETLIQEQLRQYAVLLYMKGTPEAPQCGFSKLAVTILQQCHVPFTTIDVLAQPDIRQTLPRMAHWRTFPQLYIKGELIGGSDILATLYANGELQKKLADVR